jgi:DNA repair protein RadA/Sms
VNTDRKFACTKCGHVVARWLGKCPGCGLWATVEAVIDPRIFPVGLAVPVPIAVRPSIKPTNALSEAPADLVPDSGETRTPIAPVRITDVAEESLERTLTGIEPLDRVLGGGLVAASVILIGGEPGCGKSTLVMQALAKLGQRVLYVTGEETIPKVTIRARRVNATHDELWIVPSNDIDEALAYARELKPAILAIDSIQTFVTRDISGSAGYKAQVCECTSRLAQYANSEGITVIIIGHVTKDGTLAGPNTLRHLVDVLLLLEQNEHFKAYRILRTDGKNRFGDTQEIGSFEMTADGLIPIEPPELPERVAMAVTIPAPSSIPVMAGHDDGLETESAHE